MKNCHVLRISLYPDSEVYYYFLGWFLQKNGDVVSAKKNYNNALIVNPDYDPAKAALKKLNN